jgi:hypothetical protein
VAKWDQAKWDGAKWEKARSLRHRGSYPAEGEAAAADAGRYTESSGDAANLPSSAGPGGEGTLVGGPWCEGGTG